MKYDLLAYIGRFQPFHVGHRDVIRFALGEAERVAIVLGSDGCARNPKNPWTAPEREDMIRSCFSPEENERLVFRYQRDYPYNHEKWLAEVAEKITMAALEKWVAGPYRIGLIGLQKDTTSFYLRHFPQFTAVELTPSEVINATDIRKLYFDVNPEGIKNAADLYAKLPEEILAYLECFMNREARAYHEISDEWKYYEQYRADHQFRADLPYEPTHVTTDAVITNAGHVLMVVRRDRPGRGLLALPGGFLQKGFTIKQSMLNETAEETEIKIPGAVLRGSIRSHRYFDDPGRSLRGRVITHAFHIALDEPTLPKVKGGSDASSARWIPLAQLKRDQLFEDHFDIIETLVGL